MSKFATKAAANMFCQARYEAAKSNERLSSREGAAEEIGIDRTRLARIELGSTIPYQEEVLLISKSDANSLVVGSTVSIGNATALSGNHVMTACICYDCTKLATSVTSDYVECGYSIADTQESWKYISELGYDPENPSVRHGTKVAASSSTGYADGQYTNKLDQTSDGLREWLSGGYLSNWSGAGRWCAHLVFGLGVSWWAGAARLSASGRCAKAAA